MKNLIFAIAGSNALLIRGIILELVRRLEGRLAILKLHETRTTHEAHDEHFQKTTTRDDIERLRSEQDVAWSEVREDGDCALLESELASKLKSSHVALHSPPGIVTVLRHLGYDLHVTCIATPTGLLAKPDDQDMKLINELEPDLEILWSALHGPQYETHFDELYRNVTNAMRTKPRK